MTKMTPTRLPLIALAVFLLVPLAREPSFAQAHDEPKTPPVELSNISLSFLVQNAAGSLVWESPRPGEPSTIPAGARRLRLTAKVENRREGAQIRVRATLQELCPSPDKGKNYLARLRHLTESDPDGNQTKDTSDDEVQTIQPGGRIAIEIPVHCEQCVRAACGKGCDRDHLGEGPHQVTVTTSDPPPSDPPSGRATTPLPAKLSSFRLEIKTVCKWR